MSTLRVGIVGLGGICRQRHVPGFRAIEGVELAVVANRSRASSEQAAEECGIPEVADNWTDIIKRDDIDIVVIGTWPYMHHPISIAALHARKHVFCQARMAMDYNEAVEMQTAAARSGCVAGLCPVPIGMKVDAAIARLLHEKTLGGLRLVRVQGLYDTFASPDAPMNWRKDHRYSGLNALTLGMYAEVIHRWFGPTRRVQALTKTFTPTRKDAAGQMTQVQIPDQLVVNTEVTGDTQVQYLLSGAVKGGRDLIELYGAEGATTYDVADDELFHLENGRPAAPVEIRSEEVYDVVNWQVEQDFIDAVRHGVSYHPDFTDGARYMGVVQAVYDSARTGNSVALAY
ncbi:MAG: Gfo/Idh/MocA family protein [Candidatus Hydrogenedentota bacterium]